jgi:hypothetical protein
MLKLNLSCGSHTPNDWVKIDYDMGAWIATLPVICLINKNFKIINLDWLHNIFL